MSLPERLEEVQKLMASGDGRGVRVYETPRVYLGYKIPHYFDFHDFAPMLILGRVSTGKDGDIVLVGKVISGSGRHGSNAHARRAEKPRRAGQTAVAANLPKFKK